MNSDEYYYYSSDSDSDSKPKSSKFVMRPNFRPKVPIQKGSVRLNSDLINKRRPIPSFSKTKNTIKVPLRQINAPKFLKVSDIKKPIIMPNDSDSSYYYDYDYDYESDDDDIPVPCATLRLKLMNKKVVQNSNKKNSSNQSSSKTYSTKQISNKTNSTKQISNKTNSPNQNSNKTNSPNQISNKTNSPNQISNKKKSPNQNSNKTNSPNQNSNKTNSPNQISNKTNSPNQISNKKKSPKQNSNKTNSPNQISNKINSPKQNSNKTNSPNQNSNKTNSPNQISNKANSTKQILNNKNSPNQNNDVIKNLPKQIIQPIIINYNEDEDPNEQLNVNSSSEFVDCFEYRPEYVDTNEEPVFKISEETFKLMNLIKNNSQSCNENVDLTNINDCSKEKLSFKIISKKSQFSNYTFQFCINDKCLMTASSSNIKKSVTFRVPEHFDQDDIILGTMLISNNKKQFNLNCDENEIMSISVSTIKIPFFYDGFFTVKFKNRNANKKDMILKTKMPNKKPNNKKSINKIELINNENQELIKLTKISDNQLSIEASSIINDDLKIFALGIATIIQ